MFDYVASISQAFFRNFHPGRTIVPFIRDDLFVDGVTIKNIGDVPHAYKVGRRFLPANIAACAPTRKEWAIIGTGRSKYKFTPVPQAYFYPNLTLPVVPMPEISLSSLFKLDNEDEQGILSNINRNNLVGAFLNCRTEHYQSHRKMFVEGYGQVEVDDLSLGTDPANGENVTVPVCMKRRPAILGWSQIKQDIVACQQLKPKLRVRPVGVVFISKRICLFEFAECGGELQVIREQHYQWV